MHLHWVATHAAEEWQSALPEHDPKQLQIKTSNIYKKRDQNTGKRSRKGSEQCYARHDNNKHGRQKLSSDAPTTVDQRPGLQITHEAIEEAANADDQLPRAQPMQTSLKLAPCTVDQLPALQLTQEEAPSSDDHVPGKQFIQLVAPTRDDHVPAVQATQ